MKTSPTQLRALKARVSALAGDAEVNLPASFVADLVADVEDLKEVSDRLETALVANVRALEGASSGGEEWIGSQAVPE